MIESYKDANDFLLKKGNELLKYGEKVETTNEKNEGTLKNALYELSHQFFRIEDPRATIFDIDGFKTTPFWMTGELLTEFLNKNPPVMTKYAKEIVHQSYDIQPTGDIEYSYGARWKEWNQILNAYKILKDNPNSKRVLISTWMPYDVDANKNDVPCNINYMFLGRNNKLDMTATIRSNDFLRGTKYDYALAGFMQQSMASWTGMDVGNLYFSINSLHLYEKDKNKLEKILENQKYKPSPKLEIPKNVDIETYWKDLRHIEKVENAAWHHAWEYVDKNIADIEYPIFRDLSRIYAIRNSNFHGRKDLFEKYKSDIELPEMKKWISQMHYNEKKEVNK